MGLVDEHDHDRLFYNKPAWKRIVIMGSGVAINLVLAFLLFVFVFSGYGVNKATTTVDSVSECVIAVTESNRTQPQRECTSADPAAPAKTAGFRSGDRIVSFNGTPVTSWAQVQKEIRSNGDEAATVVVERDGRELTLRPSTVVSPRVDPDNPERITKVGFLGVTPTQERERQGIGFAVSTMADGTWETLKTIGALPVKVYHVGRAAIGLEERDPDWPDERRRRWPGRRRGRLRARDLLRRPVLLAGPAAGRPQRRLGPHGRSRSSCRFWRARPPT